MEDRYIPIEVKNRVKKGSEEGTELIVEHRYVEEIRREGALYQVCANLPWVGLLLVLFGPLLVIGIVWVMGNLNVIMPDSMIVPVTMIFGIVLLILGCVLYGERERFVTVTKEEKEMQMSVFFPNVLIESIEDVKSLCPYEKATGEMERTEGIWVRSHDFDFGDEEWNKDGYKKLHNILKLENENTEEVWARGDGDDGKSYCAKFHSPELYKKVQDMMQEYWKQILLKEFDHHKKELEYLERVGRYEEAARIYESLRMPEKAGEMRRKKREVITLDLNALIRQLGERGFTITYHCSHCGAPVSISEETKAEAVQYCSHCGSRIETIDLANFIKKYLS